MVSLLTTTSRNMSVRRVDPLFVMSEDLMIKVLENLDAYSLARSLLVSRSWLSLSSVDRLWSPLCQELWVGKAHIPRISKHPGMSKLASYSLAVRDSKRVRITREDLWDHCWNFHFTEAAPAYWKNLDPHWQGTSPLMHRYFHPDGTITCGPGDLFWGGHECSYTVVTSILLINGKIKENYVRVNRWPRLVVSRRDDWGWEMSNAMFTYSSISDGEKDSGTGPMFLEHYLV